MLNWTAYVLFSAFVLGHVLLTSAENCGKVGITCSVYAVKCQFRSVFVRAIKPHFVMVPLNLTLSTLFATVFLRTSLQIIFI